MKLIAKKCFTKAIQVTDRFHVQKLALEALQEIRIKLSTLKNSLFEFLDLLPKSHLRKICIKNSNQKIIVQHCLLPKMPYNSMY